MINLFGTLVDTKICSIKHLEKKLPDDYVTK